MLELDSTYLRETSEECDMRSDHSRDFDDHDSKLNRRNRDRVRKMPYYDHIRKQRKAIQNMTKPLKLWLYRNKTHPYPTKQDKMVLASQANMTMTQVCNWFANARRRLKNTVKEPDMAWDQRIRLYNSHVTGNAELLSVSSSVDEEATAELHRKQCEDAANAVAEAVAAEATGHTVYETRVGVPTKYKHTILQRYLNDTIKYGHNSSHYPEVTTTSRVYPKLRQMSGSSADEMTSDDCMSSSPMSPRDEETWYNELKELQSFVTNGSSALFSRTSYGDLNAKELSAVMALTDLALGKS